MEKKEKKMTHDEIMKIIRGMASDAVSNGHPKEESEAVVKYVEELNDRNMIMVNKLRTTQNLCHKYSSYWVDKEIEKIIKENER